MKIKITLALAFILCLALSAFAQEAMKKDDMAMKKMTPEQMLMHNEEMAWAAIKDKRWDDFSKMLADDYQGVYADKIADKAGEMEGVKKGSVTSATLSAMKVTWIDKNAALITATMNGTGMSPDGTAMNFAMRTASVWRKNGKNWMIVYHTDMDLKPDAMTK